MEVFGNRHCMRSDTGGSDMITFLSKFFIKEKEDKGKIRQEYGILCGMVGIFLNILLFCGKFFAGTISHSIAVTADAFNNLSDAGSSFISLVGFKFSGMKADADHPFGHGRIEYVSGFGVSMIIILMGFELLKTSVGKIFHPEPVETSTLAVGILIVSICVKAYMFFYNRSVGTKIQSETMKATAMVTPSRQRQSWSRWGSRMRRESTWTDGADVWLHALFSTRDMALRRIL